MLRRPPVFWGSVTSKRVATHQRKLSRYKHDNAALVERQVSKKLALLFDHYDIEEKDWATLVRKLADQHVPGFRVQIPDAKSRKGRKLKWDFNRLNALYQTVQSIAERHNYNDRQALKFIVSNERYAATWGVPTGHKGSKQQWIETLEIPIAGGKVLEEIFGEKL